jgi:hypothetical protein
MLCDDIIETYTTGDGAFFRACEGLPVERLIDKIRRAHKFVFSEQTNRLLLDTKDRKPSAALTLLDFAKPPYDLTWLEFPQTEYRHDAELDALGGKPATKRIGFLVERAENGDLLITMGYSFKNAFNPPAINQIRVAFRNWRSSRTEEEIAALIAEWHPVRKMSANATQETQHIVEKSTAFTASLTPKEMECAKSIDLMFLRTAHPAFIKTLVRLEAKCGKEKYDEYMQGLCCDWYGEECMPLFAFAYLGCRNVFEVSEVDPPEKLNRARLKRRKEPFFSYHMVDLQPSMKERLQSAENSGIQQRSHWVRGHFKERKTGRFFWNPHLAGNPDLGFVVKDYRA